MKVSVEITGLSWQAGSGKQYKVAGRQADRRSVCRNRDVAEDAEKGREHRGEAGISSSV